jgi:hypothetical protein
MASNIAPAEEETGLGTYVVNIVEQVIYPIQVRARSSEQAALEAEAIYGGDDFDPEEESLKVETGHGIYTEHIDTEVVACNGQALSIESSLLDQVIALQQHPVHRAKLARLIRKHFGDLK